MQEHFLEDKCSPGLYFTCCSTSQPTQAPLRGQESHAEPQSVPGHHALHGLRRASEVMPPTCSTSNTHRHLAPSLVPALCRNSPGSCVSGWGWNRVMWKCLQFLKGLHLIKPSPLPAVLKGLFIPLSSSGKRTAAGTPPAPALALPRCSPQSQP